MVQKILRLVLVLIGLLGTNCSEAADLSSKLTTAESGALIHPSLFNVRDYGSIGDGTNLDTAGLQTAIDACHQSGGGAVLVPQGRYVTGTIFLRSHVELHLAPSAVILGSKDLSHYATNIARCGFVNETAIDKCLVYAENSEKISITGSGTIDGQGGAFPGRLPNGCSPASERRIHPAAVGGGSAAGGSGALNASRNSFFAPISHGT